MFYRLGIRIGGLPDLYAGHYNLIVGIDDSHFGKADDGIRVFVGREYNLVT